MKNIMNKSTKIFKEWLTKYLNNYQINVYLKLYKKPFKILRLDQVKKDNEYRFKEDQDVRFDPSFKNDKEMIKSLKEDKQIIKECKKIINSACIDDLIVHTYNNITNKETYHIMNNYDLHQLGFNFLNFLCNYLPITYKIKWILKNKNISDETFAKKVHMYQQQINYFKNNKREIKNMTLGNAINIISYYNKAIYYKFIRF